MRCGRAHSVVRVLPALLAASTLLARPATGEAVVLDIGDTLTTIQRPLLNIPAIVLPGDTLPIFCDASPRR